MPTPAAGPALPPLAPSLGLWREAAVARGCREGTTYNKGFWALSVLGSNTRSVPSPMEGWSGLASLQVTLASTPVWEMFPGGGYG